MYTLRQDNMDGHIQQAYNFDFRGLTVLECGSHEAGAETRLFRKENDCYYIDAEEAAIAKLKTIRDINVDNVFCFALSDTDGEVEFTVTSHPGNSSMNHLPGHIAELEIALNSTFKKIRVPSKSYKSFLELIGKTIDILILDIEGGETIVLRGMKELPVEKLPKIICIEAGYDWLQRKALLLELGYVIDYYDFNNVVLHHSSFLVSKNEQYVRQMNVANPRFIWFNTVIYKNDNTVPYLPLRLTR